MIENIRISNWKGLKSCDLLGLGRVNVLCGKNNSGKSTILEAISRDETRQSGRQLTENDIARISAQTVTGAGWGRNNPRYDRDYPGFLQQQILSDAVLFTGEIDALMRRIAGQIGSKFDNFQFPMNQLVNALTHEVTWSGKVVLIPPKRECELLKSVKADDPIQANGVGILNFLFMSKNQEQNSDGWRAFSKLSAAFKDISGGYNLEVFLNLDNQVELKFALDGRPWITAGACGLGLQDLLVILYFAVASDGQLLLIEEPESHLHPDVQRKLALYLREQTTKQYFLATHSNVFLSPGIADKVFFTKFAESVCVENATSRATVLHELGYSVADNLVSDLVILVEGPSDRPVIEEFLSKLGLLQRYNIKAWPMGGDIMSQLDLTVFTQSYRVIALVDKDDGSKKERKRFEDGCKVQNIEFHRLKRYALENYFSLRALREVFKGQIDNSMATIDPNQKLEKQIGIDVKRSNGRIAKAMNLEELNGTDLLLFFERVKNLLQAGSPELA